MKKKLIIIFKTYFLLLMLSFLGSVIMIGISPYSLCTNILTTVFISQYFILILVIFIFGIVKIINLDF